VQDLSAVEGTGLSGRVTKQDLLKFLESGPAPRVASGEEAQVLAAAAASQQAVAAAAVAARAVPSLPAPVAGARDRVEPMGAQRLSIARHMVASRATSPHAHTVHEVDFHRVAKVREALKAEYAERGVKLTFTAFMVKALGQALVELPLVNASVDGDSIIYRGEVNVGVAVALEGGRVASSSSPRTSRAARSRCRITASSARSSASRSSISRRSRSSPRARSRSASWSMSRPTRS
jgi:2-oxoglutarate dehydrogenase E2 component (dihydrolipoamide succinyltransferase)